MGCMDGVTIKVLNGSIYLRREREREERGEKCIKKRMDLWAWLWYRNGTLSLMDEFGLWMRGRVDGSIAVDMR